MEKIKFAAKLGYKKTDRIVRKYQGTIIRIIQIEFKLMQITLFQEEDLICLLSGDKIEFFKQNN